MLQVVAAIIEREEGILICRRRPDQRHALQWEFPGGKVEPGETPAQALARELEEELAVSGAAGELISSYEFTYPARQTIELFFFRVTAFEGEPRNLIFHEILWAERASLPAFDFVEGDRPFLREFAGG
jgi:8-oxo-dGTP diphosphatase